MTVRVVLQSVEKASLLVDDAARFVGAGRGALVLVAFAGDADAAAVRRAVAAVLSAKVFRHFAPGADIVIVPQAAMAGKMKGTSVQFHALVDKEKGAELYREFCEEMRRARGVDLDAIDENGAPLGEESAKADGVGSVISGTYGNRQALRFESSGPQTHVFDF